MGCYSLSLPFKETVEETAESKDDVVRAAELQEFNGFWNLNKEVAELLNVDLAKLSSSKPREGELTSFQSPIHGLRLGIFLLLCTVSLHSKVD